MKGLTWSKKWHIVNESKDHDGYDIALCGAYLYKPSAEEWGRRMPAHLKKVVDGTAKSTGDCKLCARSAKIKQVTVELSEPSEYTPAGDPQWNAYPFVRIKNDDIVIGVVADAGMYGINPTEAKAFAAALLAAAERVEKA